MPERRVALGAEDEIHPEEAVSEKLSSPTGSASNSGFYRFDQETYSPSSNRTRGGCASPSIRRRFGRSAAVGALRGSRSGRTAKQFIDDLAGRIGMRSP